MFQKRHFFIALFIGLGMGNLLHAQNTITAQALGDLDAASRRLGSLVNQRLAALENTARPPRIVVRDFFYGESENSLGIYWKENLAAELSHIPGRNFVILTGTAESREDYRIGGEIIRVGNTVRIYTRLTAVSDSAVLSTWNTDLALTPFITDLLEAVSPASSGAASRDRFENDSMDNPAAYTIGSGWISRTLHSPGDQDFFLLLPDQDGALSMEISGDLDMVLEFYHGESQAKLDENDDFGGEGEIESRIDYLVEGGKPYIVKVRKYSGSGTGAYQFRAAYIEIRDTRFEPNDTWEQAALIELGATVEAFLSTPSDIDWYRIELPAPGLFTVYTEGSLDTLLELYDAKNNLIADADDFGEDTNARIVLTLSSGGRFYVKASAYGSSNGNSRGDYTLITRLREPIGPDPFEIDDTLSQAKPVELGVPQRRTFTDGDDVDWASLRIEQPGAYVIIARGENTHDLDTYLTLYDEGENLITEDDDGGEDYSSRIRTTLKPGTYYIRLHVLDSGPFDEGYELLVAAE